MTNRAIFSLYQIHDDPLGAFVGDIFQSSEPMLHAAQVAIGVLSFKRTTPPPSYWQNFSRSAYPKWSSGSWTAFHWATNDGHTCLVLKEIGPHS